LERDAGGAVSRRENDALLEVNKARLKHGKGSPELAAVEERLAEVRQWAAGEHARIAGEVAGLNRENDRFQLRLRTADGQEKTLPLATIVRAYPANRLDRGGKANVYSSRWWEFLSAQPREAN